MRVTSCCSLHGRSHVHRRYLLALCLQRKFSVSRPNKHSRLSETGKERRSQAKKEGEREKKIKIKIKPRKYRNAGQGERSLAAAVHRNERQLGIKRAPCAWLALTTKRGALSDMSYSSFPFGRLLTVPARLVSAPDNLTRGRRPVVVSSLPNPEACTSLSTA